MIDVTKKGDPMTREELDARCKELRDAGLYTAARELASEWYFWHGDK